MCLQQVQGGRGAHLRCVPPASTGRRGGSLEVCASSEYREEGGGAGSLEVCASSEYREEGGLT